MSESPHLNLTTKEEVAYKLMNDISGQEGLDKDKSTYREKILDLYAECLSATGGHRRAKK